MQLEDLMKKMEREMREDHIKSGIATMGALGILFAALLMTKKDWLKR